MNRSDLGAPTGRKISRRNSNYNWATLDRFQFFENLVDATQWQKEVFEEVLHDNLIISSMMTSKKKDLYEVRFSLLNEDL